MEFWGVEVKSGEPLRVDPGEDMIVHISLAALGEKKNGGNEPVRLYMKVNDQKLVIGTLSHDKFPQLCTEIVLERPFELSHSWKDGSVFFSGYKVDAHESDTESDDDEPAEPAVAKSGVKQVNFQLPNEDAKAGQDDDDEEDSDDEDDDDSEDEEEEKKVTAEVEEDDDEDSSDEEEDDSSDEETPEKKVEEAKKRPAEANTSKTASNKKAKFVTPQKSESKKPHVHVATPHPSKGGKTSGSNGETSKQQQTPKSAGAFGCSSCNRTFNSEMGLQSHTKAKHSAAA